MSYSPEGQQLVNLLERLETELRENDLWETQEPDHSAMQSNAPFACDTMNFFQWLQWLCVPRLYEMARNQEYRLPAVSDICVAAEVNLQNEGRAAPNLVELVRALDDELNARWVAFWKGLDQAGTGTIEIAWTSFSSGV